MIGSGKLCAPFTKRILGTDAAALAISYDPRPVAGELPTARFTNATIAISANGGAGAENRVTLVRNRVDNDGGGLSALTTVIDAAAGGVCDFVCPTLKSLIDTINGIAGFKCWALDAPHDLSLLVAANAFAVVAAVQVPSVVQGSAGALKTLLRTTDGVAGHTIEGVGAKYASFLRIGEPEVRDNGVMKIMSLLLAMPIADGLIRVYRDRMDEYGDTKDVYFQFVPAVATQAEYLNDNKMEAAAYRGPIIVEVSSTDALADVAGYIKLALDTLGED
jgi:hypothetical protein